MKSCLNKNHVGLTLGIFSALCHALWAIAVGVGVGQDFINLIMPLHFLNVIYSVMPFNPGIAVMLVALAFIGGYVSGWVFAAIWDMVVKKVK